MSFLSDLFLPSGAQSSSEQEANYQRLQEEYQRRLERRRQEGTISEADYYDRLIFGQGALADQDAAAWEGFQEGWTDGWDNVLAAPGRAVDAVGSATGRSLWGIVAAIPWWAWLAGIGALFLWMGGLTLLKGRLAR